MAKLSCVLLVAVFGIVAAIPQRNLPFPTTKKPASTPPGPAPPASATSTPSPIPSTPASNSPPATTTESAPYPAAGYRPGRAFNLPTEEKKAEEPSSSYGPPAEKYGPPEDATTTVQPELSEPGNDVASDNATAQVPEGLKPGFYFIQLPGGGIQKVALLTNAALVEVPTVVSVEGATTAIEERDVEGDANEEPTTTKVPIAASEHVQPIVKSQRVAWPPVSIVQVKPTVVQSAKIVQPIRSELVVAAEPVVFVQPKSYSYSSQFRTW